MTYRRIDLGAYCVISIWFGCNNDCAICMLAPAKGKLPIPGFDRFRQVVTDIAREGRFKNLILSGAEVTTFDDLDRYVEFAASLKYFHTLQIQTNGRRLSDERYLARLVDCGVNEFFVSIHGMAKIHDALTRIPGAYGETLTGLRNLARHNVNVITNMVVTKSNYVDILPLITLLSQEKITEMHLWNYFPMEDRDSRDMVVSLREFQNLLPDLLSVARSVGKALVLKSFPECLSSGPPGFFDSHFPATVLPDLFWRVFSACGFGACVYRASGLCASGSCWGLSSAYRAKYGDERQLLKPIATASPSRMARENDAIGP
jgi:sulfatase maturation enzyme AslB (radical SAM superfamily)